MLSDFQKKHRAEARKFGEHTKRSTDDHATMAAQAIRWEDSEVFSIIYRSRVLENEFQAREFAILAANHAFRAHPELRGEDNV